jgi:serine/threonine protein kinase
MQDARLSNPPPSLGRSRIGRFEVVYPLAQGGMASVHVGRIVGMAGFEKLVAIKVIHPHLASEAAFVEMFLDEARLAAQIHHPNVGEVIEVGEDAGLHYMVSELIAGQSLRNLYMRAGALGRQLPRQMSADIGAKVCQALHEAHELADADGMPLGIVHRDVSPRNVLVSYNGFVKLIDFGIAWAKGRSSHTDAGQVKGRIGYIPPEQLAGRPVDRRGDLFSLGVMLYLMVTGRHPFPGASDAERMHRITSGACVPPRLAAANVEPELDALIRKAIARSPDDRFATAAEMGAALKSYVHASAVPPGSWDSSRELKAVMGDLFEDERLAHRERVRAAIGSAGPFDSSPRSPAPAAAAPVPLGQTAMTATGTQGSVVAARTGRLARSVRLVAAGAAVAIAAIAALSLIVPGGDPPSPAPPPADPAAAIASEVASPRRIRVEFDVQPIDAEIAVDGARLLGPERALELAPDGRPHAVIISAPGYATEESAFVADVDQTMVRRLSRLPAKRAGRERKGAAKDGRGHGKLRDLGFADNPF